MWPNEKTVVIRIVRFGLFLLAVAIGLSPAFSTTPAAWGSWTHWGDYGDGRYANPIIPADYSDVDCIRHGNEYYMISSTFQFQPGMVILRSTDMVNWQVVSHAVKDIRQIDPELDWQHMNRYGKGIWAGSLRYHAGRFYVFFGDPLKGLFMTSSRKIEGPWDDLICLLPEAGWDDCCPLFDGDKAYLVATDFKNGYQTWIFPMSADGRFLDRDKGVLVNSGSGREANKLYKIDGRYYHLFSETGGGRHLMMQRSDAALGPYREVKQLSYAQRQFHEPNQGGLLCDDEGNWFFLTHHGSGDWGGRLVSLLPVYWKDGWPIVGQPDEADIGSMVWESPKPVTSAPITRKKTDRNWLTADWEWNYYPRTTHWKYSRKRLTLSAFKPLQDGNLLTVGNILSCRSWQTEDNVMTVRMTVSKMADGQKAGLCHFSRAWSMFGVRKESSGLSLFFSDNTHSNPEDVSISLPAGLRYIWLRTEWGLDGRSRYSYSLDGKHFQPTNCEYVLSWGYYRGDRTGLFTYNSKEEAGQVGFDQVQYHHR